MIVGIGVDIVDISRYAELIQRSPGVAQKILTISEKQKSLESQAARFAAKEALAKALGTSSGLRWLDAEVCSDSAGKPYFELSGTVAARAAALGVLRVHLSLSHDGGAAIAMVVCET